MIVTFLQSLFSSQPAIVGITVEIAVKTAILCLTVWIIHLAVGRKRLLLRSALWNWCLLGLLVLPAAPFVLPRFEVATTLTETGGPASSRSISDFPPRAGDRNGAAPLSGNDIGTPHATITRFETGPEMTNPSMTRPWAGNAARTTVIAVVAVYLLALLILLARLIASLAAVAALRHHSKPVVHPAWLAALGRWRVELHVLSAVELRQSQSVSVPVVVGSRRPMIILPVGLAQAADGTTIDAVLLHELTHLARGDYAWNLVLRVVMAIYWPHPLAWLVGRMVKSIREDICDAVCVHRMGDVRCYCGILADVAVGVSRRPEAALGIAMTRSSRLSRRLSRMERNPAADHGLLTAPTRGLIAAAMMVSVGALGSLRVVAHAAGSETSLAAEGDNSGSQKPRQAASEPADDRRSREVSANPGSTDQDANRAPAEDSKTSPKTVKVKRGNFQITTSQPANLVPFAPIAIHPRHAGVVLSVEVDAGDRITAGQTLAKLDVPDLEAELAEKEATVAQAEAAAEQAKAAVALSVASVAASASTLKEAEAESSRAAAAERFAKTRFDRMVTLFNQKSIDERIVDEQKEMLSAAEAATAGAAVKVQTSQANLQRSKVEVPLAEAGLKAALLRVSAAKAELLRSQKKTEDEFRLIRSPLDGVVLEKNIEPETLLKPGVGKPLFRLATTAQIIAVVELPEREALTVKRGDPASVRLDAFGQRPAISGKISRVAYSIDPGTRTLRVEIALPNVDQRMKPGMFGTATIVIGEIPDAIWVPSSAIGKIHENGSAGTCVQIVNRRAVHTPVKLGQNNGKQAEIVEGLSEGDSVVVEFQEAPPDGEPLLDPMLIPALPKGTLKPIPLPGDPPRIGVVVVQRGDLRSALDGAGIHAALESIDGKSKPVE